MTNAYENDDRDRAERSPAVRPHEGGSDYQPLNEETPDDGTPRPLMPQSDGLLVTDDEDETFVDEATFADVDDIDEEDIDDADNIDGRDYSRDRANNPPTPPAVD